MSFGLTYQYNNQYRIDQNNKYIFYNYQSKKKNISATCVCYEVNGPPPISLRSMEEYYLSLERVHY